MMRRQNQPSGHLLIVGTTRAGKTRLLELLSTLNVDGGPRTRVSHEAADMLGAPRSAVVPPRTPNSTKRQRGQ